MQGIKPDWAKKRAQRIAKRCVPEVTEAIERGYLSSSTVDKFWRGLSPDEQRERVARLIARKDRERERARLVADLLRSHTESGSRDLHGLGRELKRALQ